MNAVFVPFKQGIILDVDDTLADTSLTCARVLWDAYPLSSVHSIEEALSAWGLPEQVPQWRQDPRCTAQLDRLLSDISFLSQLPAVDGALESVLSLSKTIPISCYLTSRLPFAFETTRKWLQNNGFPLAPVVYRDPRFINRDWKARYIEKHLPQTVGFIDNELVVPENISYRGRLVEFIRFRQLSPTSSQKITCKNWDEIVNAFCCEP